MVRSIIFAMALWFCALSMANPIMRHWTAADQLPTDEVRQIIELPNGQILVNCEGMFCLSDGKGFMPLPCERNRTMQLEHYIKGYAHLWQGDSLLWIRDFYRIYLFDARTRTFRYDIPSRMHDTLLLNFSNGDVGNEQMADYLWEDVVANGMENKASCAFIDSKQGLWIGTHNDGIYYFPPFRPTAHIVSDSAGVTDRVMQTVDSKGRVWICRSDGLLCAENGRQTLYHSGNVKGMTHVKMNFCTELPDHRFLICYTRHELGYFVPEHMTFTSLNAKLPALSRYRYFVNACPIDERWTAVYTQNGAFLLDIKEDTIAAFPQSDTIERFSDKYNCMLHLSDGLLWVGTQNGLFCLTPKDRQSGKTDYALRRIEGIRNNCIRSLVADGKGRVWAGTSCGISRITPSVINLGGDDGIPLVSMRERAAVLADNGNLVFIHSGNALFFSPDSIVPRGIEQDVVLTSLYVNDTIVSLDRLAADEIHFPYNQNYLTFLFSALNYVAPSYTKYRYRLLGLESQWQMSGNNADVACMVKYRALPPGNYTFEAQSSIGDGPWGQAIRKNIVIYPPLWQTWWAKSIYFAILLSIIGYAIHFYLKRRKEKIEKENNERINHLFELREEARRQFAEATHINPQVISIGDEEKNFAEKMLHAIEEHLDNADYGVDQLAVDVCVSRSVLYTKLRNMLGITPSEFIRNVRLKHSAQLLTESQLPINEIAESVGYNTHKAFTLNFKKMFGMTPSEYRGK